MESRRRALFATTLVVVCGMLAVATTAEADPPDVSITSAPASPTSSTSYSVSFTSSDPEATFACSLDGGGFGPCASPASGSVGEGAHTFAVTATNTGGETSTPATATWTVDTSGPSTSIASGPTGTVATDQATFAFAASEAATFACRLDGGGFSACSSPHSVAGLASGSHTFEVRAQDALGNVGSPASRTWTVDLSPPDTTITDGPSGTTGPDALEVEFSSSEPGSFECRIDGGAFVACSSPRLLSGLSDGSHTFEVRATDSVGNVDQTPAARTWTVDATPPETTIISGPAAGATVNASPTFTFSASEPSTFQCSTDGAGFTGCASPSTPTLVDGDRTFAVRAVDAAGNVDATPAVRSFTIDSTPPSVSVTAGPTGTVGTSSATFAFSASEPAAFSCSLDGGGVSSCASPATVAGLGDGSHTFSVRATDAAGNPGQAVVATWTVDTAPPETTVSSAPTGIVASRSATIAFSSSEDGTFECRLDGSAFAACTSPTTLVGVVDGPHVFEVRATDAVGNADASPASTSWSVDATPPVITLIGPTRRTVEADRPAGAAVEYAVTASDGGAAQLPAAVRCSRPSGSVFPFGTTEVECKANDAVGNEVVVKLEITVVDTTPPTINAPDFSVAATSTTGIPRSDPAIARYLTGITATDIVSTPRITTDAPESFPLGTTRFVVTAVDAAGNSTAKTVAVTVLAQGSRPPLVDLTPPTAVRSLKANAGDRRVTLTWGKPPGDVVRVEVRMRIVGEPGPARLLTTGLKTSYVATGLRNDVQHRFELVAFDRAGNASSPVSITATPKALLLARPLPNAKVVAPPRLKWRPVAGATYYNVQLYRGSAKLLSTWPVSASIQLKRTWSYDGKKHVLRAGTYTWYVWPGLGARADARYGSLLGRSTFRVVPARSLALRHVPVLGDQPSRRKSHR
jgi:hypothetical protein